MRWACKRDVGTCATIAVLVMGLVPIVLSGCTMVVDDGDNGGNGDGGGSTQCTGSVAPETDGAYFVAGAFGNDSNLGGKGDPLATIQAAIDEAADSGGGDVYVAGGVYNGSITLRSNVNVWGGYDRQTWMRCPQTQPTTIVGGPTAVSGEEVEALTLNGFVLVAGNGVNGGSSIGVRLAASTDVEISENEVIAGNGDAGAAGGDGAAGADGNNGGGGANAAACPPDRVGGAGGSSGIEVAGGAGGTGGAAGGFGGASGQGESGGAGGPAGSIGAAGHNGDGGGNGADGLSGEGGLAFGTLGDSYSAADGANGTAGAKGSGGGGGGGGGGALVFACGAGGGGGGAGAAGGRTGLGGQGGGGSFGVMLIGSVDIALIDNVIATGDGGNGGSGGAGGSGGTGGDGGVGGSPFGAQGGGGVGGPGGNGGLGGDGGGGGGGPSIGIVEDATSSLIDDNNDVNLGEPGLGGEGLSNNDGADGVQERYLKLAAAE